MLASALQPSQAHTAVSGVGILPPEPRLPEVYPPVDYITDQRALALLRMYVGLHFQHLLTTATTAEEGWLALTRYFERDTHGMRVQLQRELITIRQTERESMEQYHQRFAGIRRRLIDLGDAPTEQEAKRYLVDGLAYRYRMAGVNLLDTVVSNPDMTTAAPV